MNRKTKSVIVIVLCVAVLGLSIGYATLNSILNITGTANVGPTASNWNIRFKNAKCEVIGYAEAGTITTEGTNLELSGSILKAPEDVVICAFDVVNEGTIDAKVISVTEPNKDNFTYTGSGISKTNDENLVKNGIYSGMEYANDGNQISIGDTLNAGETKNMLLAIEYDGNSLPTNEVEISNIFAQIIYGQVAVGEKETIDNDFPGIVICSTVGKDVVSYIPGTKYVCDLGDGIKRQFYVLESSENNISLIMDRNIGGTVAWASKEDYIAAGGSETDYGSFGNNNKGPITARNYLNSVTSGWTDVTVDLPTYNQIYSVNNSDNITNSYWLYDNLGCKVSICTESIPNDTVETENVYGYWTSSAYDEMTRIMDPTMVSWVVDSHGEIIYDHVYIDDYNGIRPVITVSKSKLSSGDNGWQNVSG